ncbi:hypothetical protein [Terriglobus aquaticus]|uniref:Uncharacterized protein n=1 Tax=Terriglobus aquaticus TaxID=940139 RepID=A0ABW9KLS9_9BACT|nr:hypothetical protein [Terriglobus aquaticus]
MEAVEIRGNKTTNDLLREAGWFLLHTLFAVLNFALVMVAFWAVKPDPLSTEPKLLCTAAAFLVPMIGGFLAGRANRNTVARYVWISALIMFGVTVVHVLDLPTGAGLCDGCGPVDKLWRTFFSIDHGSGLMAGDGLLIGTWIPLSMIGYAVGSRIAIGVE